eukprot:3415471-Rhodomonas_salina.2
MRQRQPKTKKTARSYCAKDSARPLRRAAPRTPARTFCAKKTTQQRGAQHRATPASALPCCTARSTAQRTAAVQPTVGPCPKNAGLSLALYRSSVLGCLGPPTLVG